MLLEKAGGRSKLCLPLSFRKVPAQVADKRPCGLAHGGIQVRAGSIRT